MHDRFDVIVFDNHTKTIVKVLHFQGAWIFLLLSLPLNDDDDF